MEYKLVVLAKDCPSGRKAAKMASEIAKEENIDAVHLLFINDTDFFAGGGTAYLERELEQGLEHIGEAIFDKLEKIIKENNSDVNVNRIELKGKTSKVLFDFLDNNKISIFLVPLEERGPIERIVTSEDVSSYIDEIKEKVDKCIIVE